MTKLRTIEIMNLIEAIDDSILLKWNRQRGNPGIQFSRGKERPPIRDRQRVLQVFDMILVLLEKDRIQSMRKFKAEGKMENGNESEK